MLTRYDKILLFFLLFLTVISFLAVILNGTRYRGSREAVVFLGGKEVKRIDLTRKQGRLRINGCVIEVANGQVRVASSTCPNKICVATGWISQPTQVIVCAPQRVVIKIKGGFRSNKVDTISK